MPIYTYIYDCLMPLMIVCIGIGIGMYNGNICYVVCQPCSLPTLDEVSHGRWAPLAHPPPSSSSYMAAQKKTNYFCYLIRLNVNESAFGHGLCLWTTRGPAHFGPAMHSTHRFSYLFQAICCALLRTKTKRPQRVKKEKKEEKYAR